MRGTRSARLDSEPGHPRETCFFSVAQYTVDMKNDVVPVQIRGILPANSGCALFVGNDEKVFVINVEPNMGAIIATNFIFATISAILTEATLEFLGLSNLNQVSWGTMLYWAQNNDALLGGYWSWYVPPGVCIALLCTSLALINYGIDSIVNPRLRSIPTEKPAGISGLVSRLPLLFPKKYARRMVQQHGE